MAEETYVPAVGDRVRLLRDLPDGLPVDVLFRIVVVNDEKKNPGRLVGLEASERWPMLHSCDGEVQELRGWWSRPENLEKVQL